LSNAGIITSRRDGRSIIYSIRYDNMSELLVYLVEDCCQARPEICGRLVEAAGLAGRVAQV
jgi:DNA-binding transcriptional ArsR family regulator